MIPMAAAPVHLAGLVEAGGGGVERFGPAHLHQFVALAQQGRRDPVLTADGLPVEPPLVAQPGLVDGVAVDAQLAGDLVAARLDGHPATDGARRAAALHLLEVPGPGLETVGRAGEGAHRADLHGVAAEVGRERLAREGGHLHLVAPHGEVDLGVAGHLVGETGAAGALDAAFPVQQDQLGEGDGLLPMPLLLDEAALARTEGEGLVLEGAFAALVAHRAVERVVDEQELEHPVLGLLDRRGGGVDLLAVGHGDEARRRQGRSPGAHHLDQAHAAHADRLHAGVVAEAGDVDAGPFRGRDDHLAFVGLDGAAVELDGHLLGRLPRRHRGRRLP